VAAPIPRAAPVTTATLVPLTPFSFALFSLTQIS
jgi:hypothetical protein